MTRSSEELLPSADGPLDLLIATQRYWPLLGGSERLSFEVATGLARKGHRVRVSTMLCSAEERRQCRSLQPELPEVFRATPQPFLQLLSRTDRDRHKLIRGAAKRSTRARFRRNLHESIRRQPPDAIFALPTLAPCVRIACAAAKRFSVPLVLAPMLHEAHPEWPAQGIRTALADATIVLALTAYEASRLTEAYAVPSSRIRVVGPGSALLEPVAPWPRKPSVLFLGRKVPSKGIDFLIEAMKQVWQTHPDVELTLAGARFPSTRAVDQMIESLPRRLRSRVRSLDNVSENVREDLLRNAYCCVLPSRHESFGMVILEGWSAATPVITLDLPVFRATVRAGQDALLVGVGDPKLLSESIVRLLEDSKLAESIGDAGRKRIEQEFSWPHIVDGYEAAFRSALGV